MMLRLFFAFASAVAVAAGLSAQQPAPPPPQSPEPSPLTFRLEVNYVEVDAVVTDQQGNLVRDLATDDFELLEDGKPQRIAAFSLVDIPIERGERPLFAAAPIEPDVQTNTTQEGRLYLIVLDDLHTDFARAPRVKAAARQFIERSFGANDIAAVVFTGGHSNDTQDFTNNRRLLVAAIDKFTGRKTEGITLSRIEEFNNTRNTRGQGEAPRDPNEFERAYNARAAMNRIRELANFMAGVRGRRKAMLLVSEGIEYDFLDLLTNNQATGVLEEARDAIAAATRANVAIYAIDPRGLAVPDADLITTSSVPVSEDRALGGLGTRSMNTEFQRSQDSLRMIAEDTGGFAILNRNDFNNAFERVVRENSSYYVLGYYPTNERRDGRFRTITVRLKRPGLQVRARRGYVAPRGRARDATPTAPAANPVSAAVARTLASPLPVRGIPLSVFTAPMKGEAPNATVAIAVELSVDGFTFTESNGTFNNRVELGVTATDVEGKTRAATSHTLTLMMRPDTLARARERGLRVLSEITVPPGRYQLRVAAAEGGGKAASVISDLEVPDFYKQPLTMSGLSITSRTAGEVTTAKPKDPLGMLLSGPATAMRVFPRSDTLGLFAEFYENLKNVPAHTVDITTTIRTDDGRAVFQNSEERRSTELENGRGGYGFTAQIPLADFAPGLYVLHVEGRSRATGSDAGVGRDVQFRIE